MRSVTTELQHWTAWLLYEYMEFTMRFCKIYQGLSWFCTEETILEWKGAEKLFSWTILYSEKPGLLQLDLNDTSQTSHLWANLWHQYVWIILNLQHIACQAQFHGKLVCEHLCLFAQQSGRVGRSALSLSAMSFLCLYLSLSSSFCVSKRGGKGSTDVRTVKPFLSSCLCSSLT